MQSVHARRTRPLLLGLAACAARADGKVVAVRVRQGLGVLVEPCKEPQRLIPRARALVRAHGRVELAHARRARLAFADGRPDLCENMRRWRGAPRRRIAKWARSA
eukprot:5928793-Pleurochrysis_carterae.AAC.2